MQHKLPELHQVHLADVQGASHSRACCWGVCPGRAPVSAVGVYPSSVGPMLLCTVLGMMMEGSAGVQGPLHCGGRCDTQLWIW